MSGADVQIEAVETVRRELSRYRESCDGISPALNRSIETIRSFVAEVIAGRRAVVARAASSLDHAYIDERRRQEALERARQAGETPPWHLTTPVDLDGPRTAVRIASEEVDRAIEVRRNIEKLLLEAVRAVTEHRREVGLVVAHAETLLARKRDELRHYWSGAVSTNNGRVGTLSDSGHTPVHVNAEPSQTVIDPRFPQGTHSRQVDGAPRQFRYVPLSMIDDSESVVVGAESFTKGYSIADLTWAHNALLDVVLPTLARGGTIDDLRARDTAEGRQGSRSYADTHSGFLGTSAIRLELGPRGWSVSNGYHRIWVARRMGLPEIIAEVRDGTLG